MNLDDEHLGPCLTDEDRWSAVDAILSQNPIDYDLGTRILLEIWHDERLQYASGYRAVIDWDFFPSHVVVADVGGSDYDEPELIIYDKQRVCDMARKALSQDYPEDLLEEVLITFVNTSEIV